MPHERSSTRFGRARDELSGAGSGEPHVFPSLVRPYSPRGKATLPKRRPGISKKDVDSCCGGQRTRHGNNPSVKRGGTVRFYKYQAPGSAHTQWIRPRRRRGKSGVSRFFEDLPGTTTEGERGWRFDLPVASLRLKLTRVPKLGISNRPETRRGEIILLHDNTLGLNRQCPFSYPKYQTAISGSEAWHRESTISVVAPSGKHT